MASEQVMSRFKEKGIEVLVHEDKIRGILDCIVDTNKHDKQVREKAIDEVLKALNKKGVEITFDLPVEDVLGEDIDIDDFSMLLQDAIQVYRKMVIGTIEQLKEQKDDKR